MPSLPCCAAIISTSKLSHAHLALLYCHHCCRLHIHTLPCMSSLPWCGHGGDSDMHTLPAPLCCHHLYVHTLSCALPAALPWHGCGGDGNGNALLAPLCHRHHLVCLPLFFSFIFIADLFFLPSHTQHLTPPQQCSAHHRLPSPCPSCPLPAMPPSPLTPHHCATVPPSSRAWVTSATTGEIFSFPTH